MDFLPPNIGFFFPFFDGNIIKIKELGCLKVMNSPSFSAKKVSINQNRLRNADGHFWEAIAE